MAGVLKARVGGAWVPIVGSGMSAEVARWNSAWGVVAQGTFVSAATALPNGVDTQVTNALPFTSVAGRKYRIMLTCRALGGGITAGQFFGIWLRDGTTRLNSQVLTFQPVGGYNSLNYTWKFDGDGTTKSYNVTAVANGGASVFYSDNAYDTTFQIEDVGPVTFSAAPPANPTPAWIAPTLLNGWHNYGSGFTDAGYRLIGDVVQLRGMMSGGTLGTALFNLPVGYRPTRAHIVSVVATDLFGQCRIGADGVVTAQTGTAGWYSIDNISFSVT